MTELSENIDVPLPDFVRTIVRLAVSEHMLACPLAPRVSRLELRLSSLIAFMAGSGLLGGAAGALVSRLIGGS